MKKELALIQKIHDEFDSAQERLLLEAQEILSRPIPQDAARLRTLGFTSCKSVMSDSAAEQARKDSELIVYYQREYPFLKFLTEKELDRICKKYKLIHAPVTNYTGSVPSKNIADIENAQPLKKEDKRISFDFWGTSFLISMDPTGRLTAESRTTPQELFIAAPKDQFNLHGLRKTSKRGYEAPKDPIVFRKVRGGIQVLTKWGLESSDPLLLNPINN